MNFIAALGRALFALRLEAKLSQEQLAHEAGVYRNTVGLIERGEMSVSVQTLDQICQALGYRPWQLMLEAEFLMEAAEADGSAEGGRQVEVTAVAARAVAAKTKAEAGMKAAARGVATKKAGAKNVGAKAVATKGVATKVVGGEG